MCEAFWADLISFSCYIQSHLVRWYRTFFITLARLRSHDASLQVNAMIPSGSFIPSIFLERYCFRCLPIIMLFDGTLLSRLALLRWPNTCSHKTTSFFFFFIVSINLWFYPYFAKPDDILWGRNLVNAPWPEGLTILIYTSLLILTTPLHGTNSRETTPERVNTLPYSLSTFPPYKTIECACDTSPEQ